MNKLLKHLPLLFILLAAAPVHSEDEAPPTESAPTGESSPAETTPSETYSSESPPVDATESTATPPMDSPPAETASSSTEAPSERNRMEPSANEAPPTGIPSANAEGGEVKTEKKTGLARLLKKLTRKDGTQVPIAVLTPLDYTTLNFVDAAQETILTSIARYGEFDLRSIPYAPSSLTLEEFRKVVTKYRVDVVILSVLKPTNFDLFLYDRRTPYQIYAHSEVLPEEIQYQLTKEAVEEYSKVIVRRTLYAYMQDQFYELPREESRPLLNAEIPRWIASARNLAMVNRELLSKYYGSLSAGAALSKGTGDFWNSNLVAFQGGFRVSGNLYAELAVDMFAYNAFIASIRYLHMGKESPFRMLFGLGGAYLINRHTLNWDQTFGLGEGGMYVVPSFAFMLPVVEVFFKVETRVYVSSNFGGMIFTLMPGLFMQF